MYVELFEGPLDVDWSNEGDELLHHMWAALNERVSMTGHSFQRHDPTVAEPYFYFGYRPASETLVSELAFFPSPEGVRAWVGITDESQVPEQVQPWADALVEASKRLSRSKPDYEWRAVIGPVGQHSAQVLTESLEIAGLSVAASTSPYIEAVEQEQVPSISGFTINVSFPVTVKGTSQGYNWSVASEDASRNLNRLCALLSVAFQAHWKIRDAPYPYEGQDRPLPLSRFGPEHLHQSAEENWHRSEVVPPAWLPEGWHRAADDEVLATALQAHHQGLKLEEVAPSYALLAYVGAVEGLGSKLEPLERCQCCSDCPVQIGAGKRFRNSLKLVLPAKEVRYLFDNTYADRSKTAHEGRLHGGEGTAGIWPSARVFAPRPTSEDFRYRTLWDMRAASRKLLLHYLEVDEGSPTASTGN